MFWFRTGDTICWDARDGRVVFCEHDVIDGGPLVHGALLAHDVEDFVERWSAIGFVEQWDWRSVCQADGIDIQHRAFAELREWLAD